MLTRSPLHAVLAHQRTYLGAPRTWTYLNAALCSFPFFAWHFLIFIPVFIMIQYIGYRLFAEDTERLAIYLQYIRQAEQYHWTAPHQRYMKRPEGFRRRHIAHHHHHAP